MSGLAGGVPADDISPDDVSHRPPGGAATGPRSLSRENAPPDGPRLRGLLATGTSSMRGTGHELSTPVGALVVRQPLFVAPDATVAEAARIMRLAKISSALVRDGELGIVTSGDLRNRVLAEELSPDLPVRTVMTRPVVTLPDDAPLYAALLLMLDGGFEHVPITRGGTVAGVITHMDMLRHQARSPMLVLGRIRAIDRLEALAGYSAEIADTAEALFADGVEPVRIARVIASLNDALTHRLLTLAEEQLGRPPCPYAWLALGSEGRMEQVLLSDQDNALVYGRPGPEPEAYFGRLAELVVGGLLTAGFPPCPGGYMATNWCRSLPDWVQTFTTWIDLPEPQALLEAEVFLDFRAVHGELSLEPLHTALRRGAIAPIFLIQMARAATAFEPPLGPFGRVRTKERFVDLKLGGIAAIVLLARLYALAAGSDARPTLDRLEAAAGQGLLSSAGARLLGDAFGFLMALRLRTQIGALASGEEPDNRVCVDDLSWLEQRRLRDTFRSVAETQRATTLRFRVE